MSKTKAKKSYRFEVATNRSDEKMLVQGLEFYARQMSMTQQLRVERARKAAQRAQAAAKPGDDLPTVLEAEIEAFVPVLHSLLVNPMDAEQVDVDWVLNLQSEEYYRLFNFLVTGKDPDEAEEEDNPKA